MSSPATSARPLEPGTTGWSVDDLNDPQVESAWEAGRFEIIEGVLTRMPAALYDGNRRLRRLASLVERHLRHNGRPEEFVFEVDLVLSPSRVLTADAILMTQADEDRQRQENARRGQPQHEFGRILVPPTVLIESVSTGHERHDRLLKRQWYAQAGVPNYWILDPLSRSLDCLMLQKDVYILDQSGTGNALLHPTAFPALALEMVEVWR